MGVTRPAPKSLRAAAPLPASAPAPLAVWRLEAGGEEFALFELPVAAPLPRDVHARLSPAEVEVASLMIAGLSNQEIAARRRTSSRTVANQGASLFAKLGVRSRSELVAVASGAPGALEDPA